MTSLTQKTQIAFMTVLIATIAVGINGAPAFADTSDLSQNELESIFGEDFEDAKKFHELDTKVNDSEGSDFSKENLQAIVERALILGKLNAKGYVSTEQLLSDIEDGTRSFDIVFPERQSQTPTRVIYDHDTGITYACFCGNEKHVDFVTGHIYYTWWGLWKHTVSDYDYDHISLGDPYGQSTTFVEDDYSQTIYPFTDYKLHKGNSATFELDYQVTDDGNPPVAIVYQNDIVINVSNNSWQTYWHTSVPGGQSEAGDEVIVDATLPSIS